MPEIQIETHTYMIKICTKYLTNDKFETNEK